MCNINHNIIFNDNLFIITILMPKPPYYSYNLRFSKYKKKSEIVLNTLPKNITEYLIENNICKNDNKLINTYRYINVYQQINKNSFTDLILTEEVLLNSI